VAPRMAVIQVADPLVPVEQPPRYRFRHLRALDGFRGIAALLVACYHTKTIPHFTGAGQAGIEMFLVLSGFLITSILRREQTETGAIRLRRFYARRMRRLFPALLAYSLVAIGVAEVTGWWDRNPIFLNAAASLTYTSNWAQLQFSSIPILFGHTWSLAVEEQYYLTWPLVLGGLALLPDRRRWPAGVALLAAALMWRGLTIADDPTLRRIRNGTDMRALGLLAGGVLALTLEQGRRRVEGFLRAPATGLGAGVALVLSWFAVGEYTGRMFMTWMVVAIGASTVFIGHCALTDVLGGPSPLGRVLSRRPLVWLGAVSYSLYLWHPLAIAAIRQTDVALGVRPLRMALMLGVSLVLAVTSYHTVERRFRAPARPAPATRAAAGPDRRPVGR